MRRSPWVLLLFLLLTAGDSAVITGACDRDLQCGGGLCCAVSLWIRSLRMCTPMGSLGEDCHPLSHKGQTSSRIFFIFFVVFLTVVTSPSLI